MLEAGLDFGHDASQIDFQADRRWGKQLLPQASA